MSSSPKRVKPILKLTKHGRKRHASKKAVSFAEGSPERNGSGFDSGMNLRRSSRVKRKRWSNVSAKTIKPIARSEVAEAEEEEEVETARRDDNDDTISVEPLTNESMHYIGAKTIIPTFWIRDLQVMCLNCDWERIKPVLKKQLACSTASAARKTCNGKLNPDEDFYKQLEESVMERILSLKTLSTRRIFNYVRRTPYIPFQPFADLISTDDYRNSYINALEFKTLSDWLKDYESETVPKWVIINGPTGSGKTTMIHYLAIRFGLKVVEPDYKQPDSVDVNLLDNEMNKLIVIDNADVHFTSPTTGENALLSHLLKLKIPLVFTVTNKDFVNEILKNLEGEYQPTLIELNVLQEEILYQLQTFSAASFIPDIDVDSLWELIENAEQKCDIRSIVNAFQRKYGPQLVEPMLQLIDNEM